MTSFISVLPLSSRAVAPIDITEVTLDSNLELLRRWDSEVGHHIRQAPGRADARWPRWYPYISTIVFFGNLNRKARIFQISVGQDRFPVAMIALLEEERWIDAHQEPSVFLWYLSTAPETYLNSIAHRVGGIPKLLGRTALDVAVTVSLRGAASGRVWLHADPGGGRELCHWYGAQCGLTCLGSNAFPRLPARRTNDGRYFCYTGETAVWAHREMDQWRR